MQQATALLNLSFSRAVAYVYVTKAGTVQDEGRNDHRSSGSQTSKNRNSSLPSW